MAKFVTGKEKTIEEVIKEMGLNGVSYDGEEEIDDDESFVDPYEEIYNRVKEENNSLE